MLNDFFYYCLCSPTLEQSYVISRLLHKYKPESKFVGVKMPYEQSKPSPPFCETTISVKELPDLLRNKHKYQLIPTGALSTKFCLEKFGKIQSGEITLTNKTLKVYDKVSFLRRAEDTGIPVPRTWMKIEDIREYPVFYKPAYEGGGGPRGRAKDENRLRQLSKECEYIFQELITSQGTYGVAFIADNGKILASHTHFEKYSYPEDGGSAILIENFFDDRLLEYTDRLLKTFNYSGWGLAEYKYCSKRNDYVLMEINGKFWASCEFTFVNNPLFLKILFNIDSQEKSVDRMIFLNRAFARGFPFAVFLVTNNLCKCYFRKYPGLPRQIILGLIPGPLRKVLRLLKRRYPDAVDAIKTHS